MLLSLAASRELLFFGGKGGVGKTTVAAAVALAESAHGRRVLLVSTDPAHNLGHLFGREIGAQPVAIAPDLHALELDPEISGRAHLAEVGLALKKLMPPHLAGEVDRHMALSEDAPGLQEAALLERIAELVGEARSDYDLLVFDTAPSGHTARLMALPEMMSAWTEGMLKRQQAAGRFATALGNLGGDRSVPGKVFEQEGPDRDSRIRHLLLRRRERFETLRRALADRERCTFVIVLTAERLPVLETIELTARLRAANVPVGALVINKRTPADAGPFLLARREQEDRHLQTLSDALPDLSQVQLPLLAEDVVGLDAMRRFAARLATPQDH